MLSQPRSDLLKLGVGKWPVLTQSIEFDQISTE